MSDMEDDIRAAMAEVGGNAPEPDPVEEVVVAARRRSDSFVCRPPTV